MLKTTLLLAVLSCLFSVGCGPEPGGATTQYAPESVRTGACDAMDTITSSRIGPDDRVCIELTLSGYYTAGTLGARFMLDDREVGASRIEFDQTHALVERLSSGRAQSVVTFSLSHDAPLPASDAYRVVVDRSGTAMATYRFAVTR